LLSSLHVPWGYSADHLNGIRRKEANIDYYIQRGQLTCNYYTVYFIKYYQYGLNNGLINLSAINII